MKGWRNPRALAVICGVTIAIIGVQGRAPAQDQSLEEKVAILEQAYKNLAFYFNSNLTDFEATQISRSILYYSIYYRIDPKLVAAVIVVESRFNPKAVSPKGAEGLGQLMPGTARMMGIHNSFDPVQNIHGTVKYLHMQRERWAHKGHLVLDYVLASYNAGPGAVEKYNGIPPFKETQNYVVKVKEWYAKFKQ